MDGSAIDGDHLNVLKDALKDVTERLENHVCLWMFFPRNNTTDQENVIVETVNVVILCDVKRDSYYFKLTAGSRTAIIRDFLYTNDFTDTFHKVTCKTSKISSFSQRRKQGQRWSVTFTLLHINGLLLYDVTLSLISFISRIYLTGKHAQEKYFWDHEFSGWQIGSSWTSTLKGIFR